MRKTIIAGATLVVALTAAGHDIEATDSPAAVVLKWNQLLQSTLPQPGNPQTPRFYSMMHIAMFDAINAIERDFEPYRVRLRPGLGGSTKAAAAQAAHDVLVDLNPSGRWLMTRPLQPSLVIVLPTSSAAAPRLAPTSPERSWRGGSRTVGSYRRFRLTPSRPFPGAGSRRRRPTPPPRSPISSMPRRWRCSRRHTSCHRPRRRSRAHDTPPISTR